jgi:ornithine cyclodeaminase/alanine dehydrogenase-like protein (mu-crystallin family)
MQHFDADHIDRAMTFPLLVDVLDRAFAAQWTTPDRVHLTMSQDPEKYLLLMPSWTGPAERSYTGIKVATVHPQNSTLHGITSIHALYYLMDGQTGVPLATMDGTRMTLWRTAAASALASSYLSRPDSTELTMIGSGALAPFMIRAHMAVRPITRVNLWNHNIRSAHVLAEQLRAEGLPVESHPDLVSAVRRSDIVSAATLSSTPLIFGEWLKPGTHVDTVGAFTPTRRETDDDVVRMARIYCDTISGATHEGGDLAMPIADGVITRDDIVGDLHALCRKAVPGRRDDTEVTYFKSVGTALEDLAAAVAIWEAAT